MHIPQVKRTIRCVLATMSFMAAAMPALSQQNKPPREDPGRLHKYMASTMDASNYLRALDQTGMRAAIENPAQLAATNQWTEVGPHGGYGAGLKFTGRVAGLRIVGDGAGEYFVYAGGSGGGLWRCHSSALGVWTDLGQNLINPSVRAFAIDPNDSDHIVVCSGDPERYKGAGVFVTWDGGGSWSEGILPETPDGFYRVEFRLSDSDILVAASTQGLLMSFDGGLNWQFRWQGPGNPSDSPVTDLRRHPSNGLRLYAVAANTGFLRSLDGGYTWSAVPGSSGLPAANTWDRSSLAINPGNPAALAVFIGDGTNNMLGIWRSLDHGVTWSEITGDLPNISSGNQAFHAQAITFEPGQDNRLWVGSVALAHTTNGGAHWTLDSASTDFEVGHTDVTQLLISEVAGGGKLWICNDGGLYLHEMSPENTTVGLNGSGATGLRLAQIASIDSRRALQVIGLQDNGQLKSLDSGATWDHIHDGDGGEVEITDAEAVDFWYWMGGSWHLNRVLGNGTRVAHSNSGTNALHFDPFEKKIYFPDWSVVRVADAYATAPVAWSTVSLPSLHPSAGFGIASMFGSEADGKTLYFTFRTDDKRDVSVARSTGTTWTVNTTLDLAPPDGTDTIGRTIDSSVRTIEPSSERAGEAWVGVQAPVGAAKVFHTTDFGATWQDITTDLASCGVVWSLAPTPFDPLTIYAGTEIGVFRTTNGGQSWEPFQTGLPIVACRDLKYLVDPTTGGNHRLLVATYGRGVWRRDIPSRPVTYVDKTHTGSEDGSIERPYNTVTEGVAAAAIGGIVALRKNDYLEPQTVGKNILLVSWSGPSVIR